jgi:hypothetical protein
MLLPINKDAEQIPYDHALILKRTSYYTIIKSDQIQIYLAHLNPENGNLSCGLK